MEGEGYTANSDGGKQPTLKRDTPATSVSADVRGGEREGEGGQSSFGWGRVPAEETPMTLQFCCQLRAADGA